MANLNMDDWCAQLIGNKSRTAMPIMTHPGIELAGYRVIDAVISGKAHYEAINAVSSHFQTIAATMIMDLTVEAEAFGAPVCFSDDDVPSVTGRMVRDMQSVQELKVPSTNDGRLPVYLEAARLAVNNIHDKPVFGGCIGPFSLAGRLFNMTEIMTAAFLEPDTIHILLEKCSVLISDYIAALKKTGVNGIIMAEPAAGLLDESLCEAFSSVWIKKMVDTFQDNHFLFILHNCGNTGHLTRSMIKTGAGGLHFGNRIDLVKTLEVVPRNVLVLGNLDPVGVFKMATPEQLKASVAQLLKSTATFPNFILSSGCDVPPGVPLENIESFYDALIEYNL